MGGGKHGEEAKTEDESTLITLIDSLLSSKACKYGPLGPKAEGAEGLSGEIRHQTQEENKSLLETFPSSNPEVKRSLHVLRILGYGFGKTQTD